jgi:hypothetical protein
MKIIVPDSPDRPNNLQVGQYEVIIDLKACAWEKSMADMKKSKITPLSLTMFSYLTQHGLLREIESQYLWSSSLDETGKHNYTVNPRLGFVNHTSLAHHLKGIGIRRVE